MVSEHDCQRALTQKQTLWSRFEYRAAYDSEVRVELPLIPSARAAPPSGPSPFQLSLWAQRCLLFCQRALTQKQALWPRFEYLAAYDSDCRVELPLMPSASAAPPFGPSPFLSSLWAQNVFAFVSAGADTKANTMGRRRT